LRLRLKPDSGGAATFVGGLLLEGVHAVERRRAVTSVLPALPDSFEVAGGEITDLFERRANVRRKPTLRLEVFAKELLFAVIGEGQEFDFPCEAAQSRLVEVIEQVGAADADSAEVFHLGEHFVGLAGFPGSAGGFAIEDQ